MKLLILDLEKVRGEIKDEKLANLVKKCSINLENHLIQMSLLVDHDYSYSDIINLEFCLSILRNLQKGNKAIEELSKLKSSLKSIKGTLNDL